MRANPYVDVITHPADNAFLIEFAPVVETALELGITIELNNSKLMLNRIKQEPVIKLIETCKEYNCPIIINSDAHTVDEIGINDHAEEIVKIVDLPRELIVNRDSSSSLAFIKKCQSRKKV